MSGDSRSFPPSELKLKRLREEGIIPLTSDVLSFAAILGLALSFSLLLPFFAEFEALARRILPAACRLRAGPTFFKELLFDETRDLGLFLLRAGAGSILVIAGCVVFFGLLQTRFFFLLSAIYPRLSRLHASSFFRGRMERLVSAFCSLLKLILIFSAASFVLYGYFGALEEWSVSYLDGAKQQQVLESVFGAKTDLAPALKQVLLSYGRPPLAQSLRLLVVLSFIVAIVSRVLAGYLFWHGQHMTRGEIEAEYREAEQPSAFKGAREEMNSED